MPVSAFSDKTHAPSDDELKVMLAKAHAAWASLIRMVSEKIDPIEPLWKMSSAASGWSVRLVHRGRVLLYMAPREQQFLVSFALGEKAVSAAHAANLPAWVLDTIDAAPRYAEGRGVRFEVRNSRQATALARLAEIKHQH